MEMLLAGLCVVLVGGLAARLFRGKPSISSILGGWSAFIGCGISLVPAIMAMLGYRFSDMTASWGLPGASLNIGLDPLSGLFLLPILILGALAAIYGISYLKHSVQESLIGSAWLNYNLLIISMVGVVIAKNSIIFLIAWEGMALSSFFLVTLDSQNSNSRFAGWIYLTATHLGTAFLLVMFILSAKHIGSFDFGGAGSLSGMSNGLAGLVFLFALIGFGAKSGIAPAHIWLPEAHPAAPSNVSALMSGAMIKTGIYGLIRVMTFFDTIPLWWGWVLLAVGVVSGVWGILHACIQIDIKRMLAYSSVENIGIVFIGLGVGAIGCSLNLPLLSAVGFAGALLHVVNHSLFKGLLFFAAGSAVMAAGTRSLDSMGGLLKRMKWTGGLFLLGSVSIAGILPFNGFIAEFLIFYGAFSSVADRTLGAVLPSLIAIGSLAVIGGFASAAFTRVFGIAFLGEPRSEAASNAHESPRSMLFAMVVPALICVAIGFLPFLVLPLLKHAIGASIGSGSIAALASLDRVIFVLKFVAIGAGAFAVLTMLLTLYRHFVASGKPVSTAGTWDCGYAAPTARMQYTSSSFSQPISSFFCAVLGLKINLKAPRGLFPADSKLAVNVGDFIRGWLFEPVFSWVERMAHRLLVLQQGRVQVYVLYIVITLMILLVWKLR